LGNSKKRNPEKDEEIKRSTMYAILFSSRAKKELLSLPNKVILSIESKIDDLTKEPRPSGCKKLKGSTNEYRIRIGDYRVIYTVEDIVRIVSIIKIAHRKDVYR
jgi:mRNA interferase RelE/StbE